MFTPNWLMKLVYALFPQRHGLARLTRLPIVGDIVNLLFFDGDRVYYIPSSKNITIHQSIESDSIVLPDQIVEYFIQRSDSLFIMDKCVCRSANHCKDYPIDLGCLFLGDATQQINRKLGRPVSREEALEHTRLATQCGLVHTIGRSRIDAMLMGAGPTQKLLTICHCCSCCCLWGILPDLNPRISRTIQRMPGLEIKVNDQCVGCGACTRGICFMNAIRLTDGHAEISDACRGCGRCVNTCPNSAIEMHVHDNPFIEETISRIDSLVDLS